MKPKFFLLLQKGQAPIKLVPVNGVLDRRNKTWKMISDFDPEYAATITKDDVTFEMERDGCWSSNSGDFWVYLISSEKD